MINQTGKSVFAGLYKSMEEWIEVSVACPRELAGIVDRYLNDLGAAGTVEDSLEEEGASMDFPFVKGYYRGSLESTAELVKSIEGFVASLKALLPSAEPASVSVRAVSQDDWEGWKRFFKVTHVSDRVVIKPTWEAYEKKEGEAIVEIDPGMAFGTGTHETTRLCIRLLDGLVEGGETLFDVGTGSGILAIAAVKLGARSVVAIDIDEGSVRVAKENVRINGVDETVVLSTTPLEEIEGGFDIVVANILAEDLVRMKGDIVARMKEGGRVILSGILAEKADMVAEDYSASGLKLIDKIDEGAWTALMMEI